MQRKAGKKVDIRALNAFLVHGKYNVQLARRSDGELEARHQFETDTPEQLLAQVAQAAEELLAASDFNLIRKCEADDCVSIISGAHRSVQERCQPQRSCHSDRISDQRQNGFHELASSSQCVLPGDRVVPSIKSRSTQPLPGFLKTDTWPCEHDGHSDQPYRNHTWIRSRPATAFRSFPRHTNYGIREHEYHCTCRNTFQPRL